MRHKIALAAATVALLIAASACQNNGHIGQLFGTWALEAYTVDGEAVDSLTVPYQSARVPIHNVTLSFQGSVCEFVTVLDDYHNYIESYGTWSEAPGSITLDFTHTDSDRPEPGGYTYAPPAWLGMTFQEPMQMDKVDGPDRNMTLSWIDPQGVVRVYKFHKTW